MPRSRFHDQEIHFRAALYARCGPDLWVMITDLENARSAKLIRVTRTQSLYKHRLERSRMSSVIYECTSVDTNFR